MIPTRGLAALNPAALLAPFSFERRELGPHDVLIEIQHCGVCHSGIHQARNEWGGSIYPMVPGHEIVGKVSRVGSEVSRFTATSPASVASWTRAGCARIASRASSSTATAISS